MQMSDDIRRRNLGLKSKLPLQMSLLSNQAGFGGGISGPAGSQIPNYFVSPNSRKWSLGTRTCSSSCGR